MTSPNILRCLLLCGVLLFTSHCLWDKKKEDQSQVELVQKLDLSKEVMERPAPLTKLHFKTWDELKTIMPGEPNWTTLYPNKKGLLEYQIEVYNYIDKDDKELEIKEAKWEAPNADVEKAVTLYVWFQEKNGKLVAIHSLIHTNGWEF